MDETNTEGGAAVGGDVRTGGGDVVGRDASIGGDSVRGDKANVTVNVQPGPPYYPDYHTSQPGQRGRLMPDVELEFRQYFHKLTESIIRLESTVTVNNTLTKEHIEVLKSDLGAVRKFAEQIEQKFINTTAGISVVSASAQPQVPRWAVIYGAICLTVMMLGVIVAVYLLAQGA